MGDQYGIELTRFNAQTRHSPNSFAHRKPAIDHDQSIVGPNQSCIAFTPRSERGELHSLVPRSRLHELVYIALYEGQQFLCFALSEGNTDVLRLNSNGHRRPRW